jgi:hypothetical protein
MNSNAVPQVADSPTISLVAAGRALGFGATATYAMHRRGAFPVPVLEMGGKFRVATAAIRRLLALDGDAVDAVKKLAADPTLSEVDRCALALFIIGDRQ